MEEACILTRCELVTKEEKIWGAEEGGVVEWGKNLLCFTLSRWSTEESNQHRLEETAVALGGEL